jgi:hypothetical protein
MFSISTAARHRRALQLLLLFVTFILLGGSAPRKIKPTAGAIAGITNPILFVTQVPLPGDFLTVVSTFGNHLTSMEAVPRGGDLMIRYPDGTLKNLTRLAGFGTAATQQGATSIAVREPSVHWSGTKALFSMVIGSPSRLFERPPFFWQIYEVTGLGINETPVITKVPNQPTTFNNISPTYGTDERIIFVSDRSRTGEAHLLQLDEYEGRPINSGVWSLDPASGDLKQLDHSPSGDFGVTIDSFGRVIFTRWDHMQRDQARDGDDAGETHNGTFDWLDETANAAKVAVRPEQYPEGRPGTPTLDGTNLFGHRFNHFFPWEMNEDGTELETINHIGRHELHKYFDKTMTDDPNQHDFISETEHRLNQTYMTNMLQIKEDPTQPGLYWGIDAPEFETHAAGQVITLNSPMGRPADQIPLRWITHRDTANTGVPPQPTHTGMYRNPLPLSTGTVVVSHSAEIRAEANEGTRANPVSRYDFRLKTLVNGGTFSVAGTPLTDGIQRTVTFFDPDVTVTWSGTLWELDPVEVRPRAKPVRRLPVMQAPEAAIFQEEGVDVSTFRNFLQQNNLAVIVSRDLTTRDTGDRQQPFNLRVAGTNKQTVGAGGKLYDIKYLELFQADQIRGQGGMAQPSPGRRVLAQHMHDAKAINPAPAGTPPGSVKIGADGSMAAFVPARRAMTWQVINDQAPVVRERYWLTFQPGEIRLCTSCHGLNTQDQAGAVAPVNKPEALRELLRFFKTNGGNIPAGRRKGDVNGNGAVTAFDAALVLQATVGSNPLDATQKCAADFNDNGSVSAFDAALMLQCTVGGACNPNSCN